ncbi:MAG: methyltransferase domain-containing protein [archaeon]
MKFYDEKTRRFYKLVPTGTWPALEISGIIMHRVKGTDPKTDAGMKMRVLGNVSGVVLDCCTGLGYMAILAARRQSVVKVVTIEKDENVILIARKNPYSRELFYNTKIGLVNGDASLEIKKFDGASFDYIFHDPPRVSLASELYSLEFYSELFRVLKRGGKLFHYVGKPGVKQGKNYLKGIIKRLNMAGFLSVAWVDDVQGVVARK